MLTGANQKDQPHQALDKTALAVSLDAHKWRQLGLMGTVTGLCDIATAPNSKRLFAAIYNPSGSENIWRSDSDPLGAQWEHVLTMNTASDSVILRLSPNYNSDYTIYAAEVDADLIAVSHNHGASWQRHSVPGPVVDMVLKDKNTVYVALPGGRISQSTNDARSWQDTMDTPLPGINMLSVATKETILAGGQNGEVAYSTDGGTTFTEAPRVGTGNVWVIADAKYEENSIIYAGNGNEIYRLAIGASSDWECIRTIGANQQISGLAIANGLLYGAWYDTVAGGSGVERCLEPTKSIVEWDTTDIGSEAARFDTTPKSLRVSSTASAVSLWAIDTLSPALMVYDDTLTEVKPTLTVPAQVPSDPVSGGNSQFAVTWPQVSASTEYDVEIYADEQCTALVLSAPAQAPAIAYRPPDIASPAWLVDPGRISSGRDYYVRLRVRNQHSGDQIRSLWSSPVRFSMGAEGVVPVKTAYGGPVLTTPNFGAISAPLKPAFTWAPISGATEYELVLAQDVGLTQMVAGTPVILKSTAWQCPIDLDYGTTYFWGVRTTNSTVGVWSIGSFTTMEEPVEPTPVVVPPAPAPPTPVTPGYIWAIISIGATLAIALLVLAARTSSLPVLGRLPPAPAPEPAPMPPPEPVSVPTPTAIEITAQELCSAYKTNEAEADAKYRGKTLKVTGVVDSIGEDILHNPYIRLTSGGKHQVWGVRCAFSKKCEPELAQLTIGQTVTVLGKCDGRLINVLMKDCVF